MKTANLLASAALIATLGLFSSKAHASFTVRIDCYGNGGNPTWAPTSDTIRVYAWINSAWLQVGQSTSICRTNDGYIYVHSGFNANDIGALSITTNGDDAFFIDEFSLW